MFKNFDVMEVTDHVIYVENMEFVFCYDRFLKNEYNVNNFYRTQHFHFIYLDKIKKQLNSI